LSQPLRALRRLPRAPGIFRATPLSWRLSPLAPGLL